MRRALFALACSSIFAGLIVAACSDEDPVDKSPRSDAGSDAPVFGDGSPSQPDAEPPPGDVCGNRAGFENNAPWPARGGCPKRPGFSTRPGPQSGVVRWTVDLPAVDSSPVVSAAGMIWVGTTAGDIAMITAGGLIVGGHHTGGVVRAAPVLDRGGAAVVGGTDGVLYGVRGTLASPQDGGGGADGGTLRPLTLAFSRTLAPMIASPVIGGDETLYVGTTDGKLVALASQAASVKWSATTNDTLGASPAIGDGNVYVGSSDKKLYALALGDGSVAWALDLGSEAGSPAVGGDGTIYVGTADGKLHAIGKDGKERWTFVTGGAITGAPAVYAGTVYVGSEDKKLHAVSTIDGKEKWAYTTLAAVATPLITNSGIVYFGAADAKLYAVNPTGTLFFAVNVKGAVKSAPAIGPDGTLYVTTSAGVAAVGP